MVEAKTRLSDTEGVTRDAGDESLEDVIRKARRTPKHGAAITRCWWAPRSLWGRGCWSGRSRGDSRVVECLVSVMSIEYV